MSRSVGLYKVKSQNTICDPRNVLNAWKDVAKNAKNVIVACRPHLSRCL